MVSEVAFLVLCKNKGLIIYIWHAFKEDHTEMYWEFFIPTIFANAQLLIVIWCGNFSLGNLIQIALTSNIRCYLCTTKALKMVTWEMIGSIVSQRSSLELASLVTRAGSSPQNLWPILYDIGASQGATQLRQFKNV